jgi:LacI family transcriptional regulator
MATIRDVAQRAGVSASTVSRTLSGKIPVDKKTREKVLAAVKELNYQPNALAKGLKEGRTGTIGLIVPNICNPVFPLVSRGVEDVARKFGYTVILCNTDEDVKIEKDYINQLQKKWVDGIILATSGRENSHIREAKDSGLPVVLLIRKLEDQVDAVIIDNDRAAFQAVTYLIKTGHKRIAIVNGDQRLVLYRERFQGYLQALKEADMEFDNSLVLEVSDPTRCYDAVSEFLSKTDTLPDAIFAVSDPMAVQVIRAVKDAGYGVPDDVSIIGFDNLQFSPYLDPPLTTVNQPLYRMGEAAAERIISLIENKSDAPVTQVMETELVIRKTTKNRNTDQ